MKNNKTIARLRTCLLTRTTINEFGNKRLDVIIMLVDFNTIVSYELFNNGSKIEVFDNYLDAQYFYNKAQ